MAGKLRIQGGDADSEIAAQLQAKYDRERKLSFEVDQFKKKNQENYANETLAQKVGRRLGTSLSETAGTAKDIVGRGVVAPVLGFPMDMFNLGARRPEHKGSSEWFGEQMEDAGVVSPDRNPKSELLASLLNPASFAAKVAAVPALAATFAGKGAKGADLSKLFKAEEMLKKGGSDRDAYAQTGWTHGFADKKPRFEIDDSGARIAGYDGTNKTDSMMNILDHNKLYDNYPGQQYYKDVELTSKSSLPEHLRKTLSGTGDGSYFRLDDASNPKIKTTAYSPEDTSVTLHELQHDVQAREGFAKGGNVKEFRSPQEDAANSIYRARINLKKSEDLLEKHKTASGDRSQEIRYLEKEVIPKNKGELYNLIKKAEADPYKSYLKLAGEAEARLTQKRMNMTAAERAKSYPPDMFDVPVEDQIVRFDGGKQMSQKPTLKSIESANKNVQADVSEKGNILTLSKISVPKELRKKGHADAYMNDLVKLADEEGKAIALTPSDSFGANKNKLSRWYKTHGFVPNKGRNKDFSTRESMIRPIKKVVWQY